MTKKSLLRFVKLFTGLQRAYGIYTETTFNKKKKKIEGYGNTVSDRLSKVQYENHLTGLHSLGVVPITDNAKCSFAVIDIDKYNLNYTNVEKRIADIPCVLCRSKSGGLHVYFFFKKPIDAAKVRKKLKQIAVSIGFPTAEIFPKQSRLGSPEDPTSKGSWINLPYQNSENTTRYAIVNNEQLTLDQFLNYAEHNVISQTEFLKLEVKSKEHFLDGPYCLQMLSYEPLEEYRNNYMFNVGIYCKAKYGDNWIDEVVKLNNELCGPPIKSTELRQSVISSLSRAQYKYLCEQEPLASNCKKEECLLREFGVSSSEPVPLKIHSLTRLDVIPPKWFLSIEDQRVEITTDVLLSQNSFRKMCVEKLLCLPPKIKPTDWDGLIRKVLEETEIVDVPYDATPAGQIEGYIENYLSTRPYAQRREEIAFGKPWIEDGYVYFRSQEFIKYLQQQKVNMSVNELWTILHGLNAKQKQIKIQYRNYRLWGVPEINTEPIEINVEESENDF